MRRTEARSRGGRHVVLATLAVVALPGLLWAQEEERTLQICQRVGSSDLELGIEGMVRDEESEVPLPGATVVIRYESERDLATPEEVTVEADENGRYQACGLVAFREVRIRAAYSVRRGKERRIDLDRPKFVDLEIDMGDAAFVVFSVVAADDGRPVPGARLDLSPLPIGGITDSLGRVTFRAIPPGTYGLHVEHIAFASRDEELNVLSDQTVELRIELVTQAIALEPLEVTVTGRDPYLLTSGFYERRESIEDGYFGTYPEIESYQMFRTLFQFNKALSVRYRRNQVIFLNGRRASRLGYTSGASLNDINFRRVRGIEAFPCNEAPPDLQRFLEMDILTTDCNLIAIWTR